jgi:hypothetical protein
MPNLITLFQLSSAFFNYQVNASDRIMSYISKALAF